VLPGPGHGVAVAASREGDRTTGGLGVRAGRLSGPGREGGGAAALGGRNHALVDGNKRHPHAVFVVLLAGSAARITPGAAWITPGAAWSAVIMVGRVMTEDHAGDHAPAAP